MPMYTTILDVWTFVLFEINKLETWTWNYNAINPLSTCLEKDYYYNILSLIQDSRTFIQCNLLLLNVYVWLHKYGGTIWL